MLRLDPENLVLKFLRYVENTNIIVTTQDFEVEKGLVEHSLKPRFSLIRLGLNAKRHAGFVLGNTMLLKQLESATYPCLFQGKAIDLAQFSVGI